MTLELFSNFTPTKLWTHYSPWTLEFDFPQFHDQEILDYRFIVEHLIMGKSPEDGSPIAFIKDSDTLYRAYGIELDPNSNIYELTTWVVDCSRFDLYMSTVTRDANFPDLLFLLQTMSDAQDHADWLEIWDRGKTLNQPTTSTADAIEMLIQTVKELNAVSHEIQNITAPLVEKAHVLINALEDK